MHKRNFFYLALTIAAVAPANVPVRKSGIDGFVTSDIQAVIAGAAVGIDNVGTGLHRQTATNTSGYYVFDDLRPGAYTVWSEVKGYGCILYPHIVVAEGALIRQDFYFARAKRTPGSCEPLTAKPSK